MTMTYLLALDQGTSSSRSIVFADSGEIVAMAQQEFKQLFPQPGWVEHDPMALWQSQLATCREVLAKAGIRADQLAALGISNQRETTVVWERSTGTPIFNAIVWQDRRTEALCAELRSQGLADSIRRKTGLVLDPYFSATKLRMDTRPCRWRARTRAARRTGLRHRRCVAGLEPDWRPPARDRCD